MFSRDLKELALIHFNNGASANVIFDILGSRISKRTIYRWISQFKSTGAFHVGKSSGRPSTSSTQLAAIKTKMKYRKNTKKRVSKVVQSLGIPRTTFRRRLKELSLKAYHTRRVPFLTDKHKTSRVIFTRHMRKERHGIYRGKPILFSDEKKFTVVYSTLI